MSGAELQKDHTTLAHERDVLRLLLESSTNVLAQIQLSGVWGELANCLRGLQCNLVELSLIDSATGRLESYPAVSRGIRFSASEPVLVEAIHKNRPVSRNTAGDSGLSTEVASRLTAEGIRSICIVPLFARGRSLGVLCLGSPRDDAFSKDFMEMLTPFAGNVGIAIEHSREHELAKNDRERAKERDRYRLLLELNNAIVSNLALRDLFYAVSAAL